MDWKYVCVEREMGEEKYKHSALLYQKSFLVGLSLGLMCLALFAYLHVL